MLVLYMEKNFLVYDDRKCSQLLKFFQLITALFSCAVSDFLYEEFSAKPIRAKITVMLFSIRMVLLILFVLLPIKIHDKSKLLC